MTAAGVGKGLRPVSSTGWLRVSPPGVKAKKRLTTSHRMSQAETATSTISAPRTKSDNSDFLGGGDDRPGDLLGAAGFIG
jgi:hypothetical protein